MTSYKIARRAFLRSAGASAVLLPLLKNIEARAQGMPAPLRFMILHHPLGTQHIGPASSTELWRPTATATTTNFTLPQNSSPFNPLKPKMVMIDGLNIVTASQMAGNGGGQNTHEGGVVALSTGVPTLGQIGQQDHAAGGPSIDQILLDRSPVLGGTLSKSMSTTQFQFLALAADIRSDRDEVAPRVLSYRPPLTNQSNISLARQPLFPETQPINVYNRIFGSVMSTGGNPSGAAAKLAQQQSALDFVSADLARLRTLAPASETMKLDSFAAAIQQLESSLRLSLQPPVSTGGCQKPATPEMFGMTGAGASGSLAPTGGSLLKGVDYYNPSNLTDHPHQRLGLQQLAMIQAVFQCDYARVATFMWSPGTNWVVFPTAYQGATLPTSPPSASSPHHPPSHTTNPATMAWLAQLDSFYAQQSSAAIQAMDAVKDFDGNTLLDNTVVVYISEIARAYDHDQENIPILVFGGKNTGIKGGQYLKIKDGPLPGVDGNATGNRPLNDLWLALAPIFGVSLPSLGSRAQYTGPLPGLVA